MVTTLLDSAPSVCVYEFITFRIISVLEYGQLGTINKMSRKTKIFIRLAMQVVSKKITPKKNSVVLSKYFL